MTARTIRAAIFDMDGVLTDSEPLINAAAIEMFREKGLNVRPLDFQLFDEFLLCDDAVVDILAQAIVVCS